MTRRRVRQVQTPLPDFFVPPPPPPAPFRKPDPERGQREARSAATLAALLRNLANGTPATETEGR